MKPSLEEEEDVSHLRRDDEARLHEWEDTSRHEKWDNLTTKLNHHVEQDEEEEELVSTRWEEDQSMWNNIEKSSLMRERNDIRSFYKNNNHIVQS